MIRAFFLWVLLSGLALGNNNAVCLIRTEPDVERKGSSTGSGFFISKNTLLTAYHVVDDSIIQPRKMRVEHNGVIHSAKVKDYDENKDIALVEIDGEVNSKDIAIIDSIEPRSGMLMYNAGHPGSMWDVYKAWGKYTKTSFTSFEDSDGKRLPHCLVYVSDLNIRYGMSGGPLINPETNKVAGLLIRKHNYDNKTYNLSLKEIQNFLKKALTTDK